MLRNPFSLRKRVSDFLTTMHNHAPKDYACPFCRILARTKDSMDDTDAVYQDETVTAFLGLGRWEMNPVDVLIVPNRHVENLYDLPLELAPALQQVTQKVAISLKALTRCEGVSTRQHNEPAGGQDVWHFHVHVTPRFEGDRFYEDRKIPFPEAERLALAERLRKVLAGAHST
jgi:histidine triad (HIT) family protein